MTLVFDTETTGKADFNQPPEHECQPRLVQLAALLLDYDLNSVAEFSCIIKPDGFEIPVEASKIHGITTQCALSMGIPEIKALEIFKEFATMSKTLVAHNITFDAIVIGRANKIHNLVYTPPTPYCTMKSATNVCKIPGSRGDYKWPSLQEAHKIILGTGFEGAHDAMADVRACARVYAFLLTGKKPAVRPVTPIMATSDTNTPASEYNDNTPMPFGKYRGTPLGKLDQSYCEWLYAQEHLSDKKLSKWLGKT